MSGFQMAFENRPTLGHSKSGQVRISDPHCTKHLGARAPTNISVWCLDAKSKCPKTTKFERFEFVLVM